MVAVKTTAIFWYKKTPHPYLNDIAFDAGMVFLKMKTLSRDLKFGKGIRITLMEYSSESLSTSLGAKEKDR